MPYSRVIDRLEELEGLTAVGFPDGSVDTYVEIESGRSGEISDRTEVAERIEENSDTSLRFLPLRKEVGGKSVNMSVQCHGLGLETRHYGFLDHPVFEDLDFPVFSMGLPAEVTICEFENGTLLFTEENEELVNWSLEDMNRFQQDLTQILSADVVCCANWVSLHHMSRELEKLKDIEFEAQVFNFDPGNLMDVEEKEIRRMFDILNELSDDCEVLVHANTDEVEAVADIYDVDGGIEEKVSGVQARTGVDAYVLHDKQKAVAGTDSGPVKVENLVTHNVATRTGAGDRFDAAVAAARAADWNWEEALALGNLCAVQYVENGRTATPEDLRSQFDDKVD